jgi:hypothetical protein
VLAYPTDEDTKPVVAPCDNSAEPCTGEELDNAEHPAVYTGPFTFTWGQLNDIGSQSYFSCVEDTLDISWGDTVRPLIERSEANWRDTAFILAVNVDEAITDDELRELVDRPEGMSIEDLQELQVVRTPQITNTRAPTKGSCEEFDDTESQVEISLGLLDEDYQLITRKGIFGGRHNPWSID